MVSIVYSSINMDCYEKTFFQAMNGNLHMLQEQKLGL